MDIKSRRSTPIAIVGMASHLPDSRTLFDFWNNIQNKKDSITDNLGWDGYWKKEDFYDPDTSNKDKTYAYKGGWIPPIDFDPVEFKLPPNMLDSISTAQLFSLYVAKQALRDAGIIGDENNLVDREKVGVILGGAGNGNTSFSLAARQQAPYLKEIMTSAGLPEYVVNDVIQRLLDQYLEWNEDSFPGFLGNVACGRISSYFDLGGTSNMVDAACASSLAAVKAAVGELAEGSCDAVLTGGVNLENSIFSFLCFSRTPALSPSNTSRPFDQKSDGMMLGDGVGFLVLKRLDDAIRHNDRVYAVLKSISGSSDGCAKSIFAPRFEGQVRALNRAYDAAGITPAAIDLIEAHGTGTVSGDQTEIKSLKTVYNNHNLEHGSIAMGSVKSQIGHTRCAAGAASMIKVALGLHHKVLPPTINVETPNKALGMDDSPFYVNSHARPWIKTEDAGARTAAVSAFGFGGTNYHVVMEEFQAEQQAPYRLNRVADVVFFHEQTPVDLLAICKTALDSFKSEEGIKHFRGHLDQQKNGAIPPDSARIAFVARDLDEVISLLETAIQQFDNQLDKPWEHPLGIFYKPFAGSDLSDIVTLFPGQGSQYPNMAINMANEFPEMRQTVAEFDSTRLTMGLTPLSNIIYPPSAYSTEQQQEQVASLRSTDNAQPGIGAVSVGYWDLLRKSGLTSSFAAGHSYGELVALHVAGVFDREALRRLSIARGQAMKMMPAHGQDPGAMLAVALSEAEIVPAIEHYDDVFFANYNAENQVVLGGGTESINKLYASLKSNGKRCSLLPVAAAFHTRFVEHALEPFKAALQSVEFSKPRSKVFCNVTGDLYPEDPDQIRELLASQLVNPVHFRRMVESIYREGGRRFIEIGPKGVLGKLVAEILADKPHVVLSVDPGEKADDSVQFRRAQAKLLVEGIPLKHLDDYKLREPLPEPKGALTYHMNGGFFFSTQGQQRRERGRRKDTSLVDRFLDERLQSYSETHPKALPEYHSESQEPFQMPAHSLASEPLSGNGASEWHPIPEIAESDLFTATHESYLQDESYEMEPNQKPNQQTAKTNASLLNAQLMAQNNVNLVHQQFQDNQREYIQFLNNLMQQQFQLFDKHHQTTNFKNMIDSLSESFRLLDRNQDHYHTNHERYFLNQYALMGGKSDVSDRYTATIQQSAQERALAPMDPAPVTQPQPASMANTQEISAPQPNLPEIPIAAVGQQQTSAQSLQSPSQPQVSNTTPEAKTELSEKDQEALRQLREVSPESMTNELVKIISDKTGYPADMIGVDMDLEADLGIDSIKRIEIIGAMFESFSGDMQMDYDAEDYSELETFDVDQFSSINKMVAFLMNFVEEIIEQLESGKSLEELENAAREGNADSNSSANEALPEGRGAEEESVEVDEGVAAVMSAIGFVTTTNDLEDISENPKSEPADSPSVGEEAGTRAIAKQADAKSGVVDTPKLMKPTLDRLPIHRFRTKISELGMPDHRRLEMAAGHVLMIVSDTMRLAVPLVDALAHEGYKVALVSLKEVPKNLDNDAITNYQVTEWDEPGLAAALDKIRLNDGPIGGMLFLQGGSPDYKSVKACFNKKDYSLALVQFLLAKLLSKDLNAAAEKADAVFMLVSQLDGQLGTAGSNGFSLINAGLSGLAKSLHHEWNRVFCRSLDIGPKAPVADAVRWIMEELHDPRTDLLEVGRKGSHERCSLGLAEESVEQSDEKVLTPQDTVLVTGGARGITAECIIKLAARNPANYILLGRTDIDQPLPAWAGDSRDEKGLRAAAIRHMRSEGEQVTPVKVEGLLASVIRVSEVHSALERLSATGSKAHYLSVDVLDKKDLAKQLDKIQKETGAITAIVHGAGNLADKKVEKKTVEDFENVFATKVKGLDNLVQVLDVGLLKQVVVFSSVSGFFGNAGQTDYSMANEVLNKFAHLCHVFHPDALVKAINWGPWDSGMVNDTLKKAYHDRGIAIIGADEGAEFFANEFYNPLDTQVVVGSAIYQTPKTIKTVTPRIFSRQIAIQDNPFLRDHQVDGNPVLPATCAINWMVEAAQCLLPGYHPITIKDFAVLKGVVFENDEPLHFNVEVTPTEQIVEDRPKAKVVSVQVFNGTNGSRLNRYGCSIVMDLDSVHPVRQLPLPCEQSVSMHQWSLYGESEKPRLLFHGPSFQGISQVLSCTDEQISIRCSLSAENVNQGQFRCNGFNPYVADVCIQAPYIWLPMMSELAGLPSGVTRIDQYGELPFDQDVYVTCHITKQTSTELVTQIEVTNTNGDLLCDMQGVRFATSRNLKQKLVGHAQAQLES